MYCIIIANFNLAENNFIFGNFFAENKLALPKIKTVDFVSIFFIVWTSDKIIFGKNNFILWMCFFSSLLTAGIAGQHVQLSVADGISLDHLDKKWEVNADEMQGRVNALTPFEACCLELWANGFWYAQAGG